MYHSGHGHKKGVGLSSRLCFAFSSLAKHILAPMLMRDLLPESQREATAQCHFFQGRAPLCGSWHHVWAGSCHGCLHSKVWPRGRSLEALNRWQSSTEKTTELPHCNSLAKKFTHTNRTETVCLELTIKELSEPCQVNLM